MRELSLNILDVAENSVRAGATQIGIVIEETDEILRVTVTDNGCGMREAEVARVCDPFYTTRKTRTVGLGVPLFCLAAERTGGSFSVTSRHVSEFPDAHGTEVCALLYRQHIDCIPLGDITSTVVTLIQGNPGRDLTFRYTGDFGTVELDTAEMRETLGAEIPLNSPEVLAWVRRYLTEQMKNRQIREDERIDEEIDRYRKEHEL